MILMSLMHLLRTITLIRVHLAIHNSSLLGNLVFGKKCNINIKKKTIKERIIVKLFIKFI